ncbi:hypothetical protein GW796_09655 [archaeon]|nr:hypothetical protein [archaeon]
MLDEYTASPCVGSGLCCKTGPCAFGIWLKEEKRCYYLEESYSADDFKIYRCGNYEYIKKQPGNEIMPAFGAGCCMGLFNSNREKIKKAIFSGKHNDALMKIGIILENKE